MRNIPKLPRFLNHWAILVLAVFVLSGCDVQKQRARQVKRAGNEIHRLTVKYPELIKTKKAVKIGTIQGYTYQDTTKKELQTRLASTADVNEIAELIEKNKGQSSETIAKKIIRKTDTLYRLIYAADTFHWETDSFSITAVRDSLGVWDRSFELKQQQGAAEVEETQVVVQAPTVWEQIKQFAKAFWWALLLIGLVFLIWRNLPFVSRFWRG